MDTGMRDLERIRERDPERGTGRRVAVMALAALATVALIFAVGVVVGDVGDGETSPPDDPLRVLDRASRLSPRTGEEPAEGDTEVDKGTLTFPQQLVDHVAERPEMTATLAAAEAELAHPDPLPGGNRGSQRAGSGASESGGDSAGREPGPADPVAASTARGEEKPLARAMARDPLAASAQDDSSDADLAPRGRAGRYTLQVISYRSADEAHAFARGLRTRGHRAFVVSADIPERGRHWRVRIGPFDTKREAQSYRADFERDERMNTYIVKREDDKERG